MRSSTLSIATLLLAACSLTGALAAGDEQSAAPLATAGTTPNNLTGAGAMFGNKYQGDATYYGDNRGAGACSYQFSGVNGEPWVDGVAYRVALNSRQWLNSEPCGMCLKFRGFSKGAGANPVTNVTRYVMVTNLCPECYSGDLDQELPGDGRWIVEWEPVQCNVGYTPFVYSFQGSNGYFMKFQVANHRVPVRAVWWGARGQWFPMARTADNYFSLSSPDGQAFEMPARVAIRSVFGDTVYDTVALSRPSGRVKGAVQFPYRAEVARVPGQARFDGPGSLPPTLGGSVSGAPQGSGSGAVSSASSPPIAPVSSEPLPTEAPPGTKAPPAPAASPVPAATTPAATPSSSASPPATPAPAPLWPFGKLSWPKGWGAAKAASAEADKGGPPPSPSSPGSFFSAAAAGSGGSSFWPGPAGPGYKSGGGPGASAESDASATADACSVAVETSNQCGGKGGWCRGPQCGDAVWSGACCLQPGARCVRYDAQYWECRMNPFPAEGADGEL